MLRLFRLFLLILPILPIFAETFDFKEKEGFSISFPQKWQQIPDELLQQMLLKIRLQSGDAPVPTYDYGFQIEDKVPFELPYAYIFINRDGRFSPGQIKKLANRDFSPAAKAIREKYALITGDLFFDRMQFDEARSLLIIEGHSKVPVIGDVLVYSGLFFTAEGFIQFSFYSTAEEALTYLPVFKDILESVTLAPDVQYHNRWYESWPILNLIDWPSLRGYSWLMMVVGQLLLFVTLIRWYMRRGQKQPKSCSTGK